MNAKTIVYTALGVGGTIIAGVIAKKGFSKEAVDVASKVVSEPEKMFGGVPLSKLTEIAKTIDPRNYCTIDQWGFLRLHYKSNRGHQNFQTQLDLDSARKLFDLNGGPTFPGQRWSHAIEFVKRVNESIEFSKSRK